MTEEMPEIRPHSTVPRGESRTKQSFKAESDINTIMAKHQKTGLIDHVAKFNGRYEDLPDSFDYQTGLNQIIEAEAAFASLPSSIRNRFANDPKEFLAFVEDPENEEEMVDLGLLKRGDMTTQDTPDDEPLPEPEVPPTPAPV